ncbi:hypothetical protein RJT34_19318 [Clitoria ternatea]|uniref:Uncharacterized protein n=1 Tax=Clitoria ternatea TaxID=43366 RepID=A0AAN9P3H9_CLITE
MAKYTQIMMEDIMVMVTYRLCRKIPQESCHETQSLASTAPSSPLISHLWLWADANAEGKLLLPTLS